MPATALSPVRMWGAVAVSLIIIVGFLGMGWLVLTRRAPDGQETAAAIVLGNAAIMAGQVANYWLGSSAGSQAKDAAIAVAPTNMKGPP